MPSRKRGKSTPAPPAIAPNQTAEPDPDPQSSNWAKYIDPVFNVTTPRFQPRNERHLLPKFAKMKTEERNLYSPSIGDIDHLAFFSRKLRGEFAVFYLPAKGMLRGPYTQYLLRRDRNDKNLVHPVEVLMENVVNASHVMAALDHNLNTRGEKRKNDIPSASALIWQNRAAPDHNRFLDKEIVPKTTTTAPEKPKGKRNGTTAGPGAESERPVKKPKMSKKDLDKLQDDLSDVENETEWPDDLDNLQLPKDDDSVLLSSDDDNVPLLSDDEVDPKGLLERNDEQNEPRYSKDAFGLLREGLIPEEDIPRKLQAADDKMEELRVKHRKDMESEDKEALCKRVSTISYYSIRDARERALVTQDLYDSRRRVEEVESENKDLQRRLDGLQDQTLQLKKLQFQLEKSHDRQTGIEAVAQELRTQVDQLRVRLTSRDIFIAQAGLVPPEWSVTASERGRD